MHVEARKKKKRLSEIHIRIWRAPNRDGDNCAWGTRRKSSLSWLMDEVHLDVAAAAARGVKFQSLPNISHWVIDHGVGGAEGQSGVKLVLPLPSWDGCHRADNLFKSSPWVS